MLAPIRAATRLTRSFYKYLSLPAAAKVEARNDFRGLPSADPGCERAIDEAAAWLCRAQDCSASADGGVARHYSLISGWASSYPETTGYIIPTLLAYAELRDDDGIRRRVRRMLDWLVSIQLPCGGFQGGTVGAASASPVTFNTGQILLGLAGGVREFGEYREAMRRAADWLLETQDADGCWRKFPTPFAARGEKTYETHVAWGLFEAARVAGNDAYGEAALANARWAVRQQRDNGWFDNCCLTDPSYPLTHTIGYALRGIVEAYRFSGEKFFLRSAQKTADGLLGSLRKDGYLSGRFGFDWSGAANWACLTGTSQIAICWLLLYQDTQNTRYREAAYAANAYVRRTMNVDGPVETRGAIKGSFPVSGAYGSYQYINWASKFFIDASLLEKQVRLD